MKPKTFTHPLNVSLHDIDAAGLMFFGHYFRHAHDAYEAFMRDLGLSLPKLVREGILLPLVHSEADYLLPVKHGDRLNVQISDKRLGTSSFTLSCRFLDDQARDAARVETTHVMLDLESKRPKDLPESIHGILNEYLVEPDVDLNPSQD